MNGFGIGSSTAAISARGLMHPAVVNKKLKAEVDAGKYLMGMLSENSGYVSREIAHILKDVKTDEYNTACLFQRGPYLLEVGVEACFANTERTELNLDKSAVKISFEAEGRDVSHSNCLLNYFLNQLPLMRFALYDHKTGKMSRFHQVIENTRDPIRIFFNECKERPWPSKEQIEKAYPAHDLEKEPHAYSLLVFDRDEDLVIPGLV